MYPDRFTDPSRRVTATTESFQPLPVACSRMDERSQERSGERRAERDRAGGPFGTVVGWSFGPFGAAIGGVVDANRFALKVSFGADRDLDGSVGTDRGTTIEIEDETVPEVEEEEDAADDGD